ncbi:hypothetical protein F5884DRAFT_787090 [Xylogone sp. PMI_703]|nr:hypothetical protein F5884DRAFT_787090 [Xylogone sp. PMI_703]
MAEEVAVKFEDIDWERQQELDEANFQRLINAPPERDESSGLFDLDRPLDVGEKADDAQDFEDISDDDLPEEEEGAGGNGADLPGLTDDAGTSNETDDLFGEGRGSSPLDEIDEQDTFNQPRIHQAQHSDEDIEGPYQESTAELFELNFGPEAKRYLAANQDLSIPAPAETEEDFLKQSWPSFTKGIILNWNELLPTKKAHYIPKVPAKPPKSLNLTKVSLDLAPDQEKSFRTAGPAVSDKRKRMLEAEAKGLVAIVEDSADEKSVEDEFEWEMPSQTETLNGLTWTDLEIICDDWDSKINAESFDTPMIDEIQEDELEEWDREILGHSAKRRKIKHEEVDIMNIPRYSLPVFDNFEQATAWIAQRVTLDLNDPQLLVDVQEINPAKKRQRLGGNFKRTGGGSLSKTLSQRYNISNDEAYDALKENHQSKVRATIGNLTVEHSLPAMKLQWPYYRVKLYTREARSFHRPSIKFNKVVNQHVTFSKPGARKKKNVKGLSTQEVFKETKDLSLSDVHANATLLEYSEEHPTVLSNFGMGNRIINYYRRKNADDIERPKPPDGVGDVTVLLPEDRSPFANFGMVDPGEIVPTLHNAMYRAPIFKHQPKDTDFLVIRNSTGVGGMQWYIRNIDHLYVVGQQFPSMEIPGPHSRKVTNAAKNRMKMIAFRKIRHSPQQNLKIGEITAHIADSTDMQNRQKLKEFIHYDKVDKVWRMKAGESVPDEATIRSMVTPEEVCVIDAMQVGSRHLEDAGYAAQDDDDDADDQAEGHSLEQSLAPWKTSKAFLEASADKAMLQLHGEGDPSGCGLAFSFIKTSMKGGYIGALQGPNATSADAIARERKANGGHTYNVKKQQGLYNDAIREIWEKQKSNLSDPTEHAENELEREQAEEDERLGVDQTPRGGATPAGFGGFDDSVSQISRFSTGSRQGRVMRITRQVRNKFGGLDEVQEIVKDVRVWREYQKRRLAMDADKMNVYDAKPTGNADFDRQEAARIKKELARLERNKERRHAREKQKGIFRASSEAQDAGSPSATPAQSVEKPTGTTRKCANCGQMGHIKTNKKLCPMLNGTMKPEDTIPSNGGFGAINAPSFSS